MTRMAALRSLGPGLALSLLCAAPLVHGSEGEVTETKTETVTKKKVKHERQDADNTAVNKRDRKADEPTADQGKNNRSDLQLAAQIRRAIVKDKALSINAHNVKIIAQNGTVTLKGPVRSEGEKKSVEQKAAEIAGDSNVKSEIAVKP